MIVIGWNENNKKENLNELAEAIIFVAFPDASVYYASKVPQNVQPKVILRMRS